MIEIERLARLRQTMSSLDVPAVLTADPINIIYATGVRNMTLYSMMGAFRFALVVADGPMVVLWESPGSEHLAAGSPVVTHARTAPGVTAVSGPDYGLSVEGFAAEVAELLPAGPGANRRLAVERFDHPMTDALRTVGFELTSATEVFVAARRIKTPTELTAMRDAMGSVTAAVESMRTQILPGRSEVGVWSELHRQLIADGGEYLSTRLVQAGHRTFPYFNEAGHTKVANGDLFCVDTDAIGPQSYAVDFSRTFLCGDVAPTGIQQDLVSMALAQLTHNANLLEPGRAFESFARSAWMVPERFAPYGYYCVAHGLGLSGEYPYVPLHDPERPYPLDGVFEPGMVICVESYIGDAESRQGVKLEDQYLITETGAELMSTMPHQLRS